MTPHRPPILRSAFLTLLLSAPITGALSQQPATIEFSPLEWKYGMIIQGEIARTKIEARNKTDRPVRVSLVPTCDCLTVEPGSRLLAPRAAGSFELSFDSDAYSGITIRGYVVNTDIPEAKPSYYLLRGVVRVEREPASAPGAGFPQSDASSAAVTKALRLSYYYTVGCKNCEEFLSKEIPQLESRMGLKLEVVKKDLLDTTSFEELTSRAAAMGQKIEAVPVLALGNRLIQGDERIRKELPPLLIAARESPKNFGLAAEGSATVEGSAGAQKAGSDGPQAQTLPASDRLAILPVLAAGLIDGVNPCAFTTLIFLLASLALAGKGRREVLVIGALFSFGVFITYLGIGIGLFAALRAASAIAIVSTILRWILVAVLVVFALLSVYDYAKIRAGRPSEILLQLPNSLKLKIHASIRTRVRTVALAGSSFGLGFLVSIFEFACTGQVYLPTLAYLARERGRSDALLLLLLYNLCFIAPLLVVFGASYYGVSSKRIATVFQRRMGAIKLGLALVFLALAALTLLT